MGLGLQLLVVGLQLLDLGLRAAQLLLQLDLRLFGLRVGAKQLLVLGLQLLICGERAVQLGCGIGLEGAKDVGCARVQRSQQARDADDEVKGNVASRGEDNDVRDDSEGRGHKRGEAYAVQQTVEDRKDDNVDHGAAEE